MIKTLLRQYKFPLFLSLIFTVIALSLKVETNAVNASYFLVGAFLGTFFLDLDYFLFAYITDPEHYFSRELKRLLRERKILELLQYIKTHKRTINGLVLHSALFQAITAALAFYIVSSTPYTLAKALIMTTFLQTFYVQILEYDKEKTLDNWFWIMNDKPKNNFLMGYFICMGLLFLYSFSILI